jgi:pimeloyl-ACP methyl ester carboxylesterase
MEPAGLFRLRKRYIVLIISFIMIASGITAAWGIQSNFGSVHTTEVGLVTAEGGYIHSTLQVHSAASPSNPMPGVVVIHGVIQSKEWLMGFGIELARRGYVVLTIDASAHGNSDPSPGTGADRGGIAALEYLSSQPFVSTLGMVGHSMGAGIAINTINESSVTVDGLVLVGGATSALTTSWANTTYPRNVLVTVGYYDELFDVPNLLTSLAGFFGTAPPLVFGQQYGTFADGSARMIIAPPSNHLFETIDPVIISESVDWFRNSLKGGGYDAYWIPKQSLTYQFHIIGGFIACLGIQLSLAPLMAIIIDLPPFKKLKESPSSEYAASSKSYWGFGALYGIIGVGTFLPFLLIGLFIDFPQSIGASVGVWLLGSGLIAAGVLLLIKRMSGNKSLTWSDWGAFGSDAKGFLKAFGLSALLALVLVLYLYLVVLPVDVLLALDFRTFLPLFNDLTPIRALIMPLYLIFAIPFFVVEGIWLIGLLRTPPKQTWFKTQMVWTVKAAFIKVIPYVLVLLIQFSLTLATGAPFFSGQIGFMLLFLWMFIPMLAVAACTTAWSYRLSNRVYIGAVFNALVFSWILASILTLAI